MAKEKLAAKGAPKQMPPPVKAKSRLSQEDVPAATLTQALRVPRAIVDQYAGKTSTPLDVAAGMEMLPSSGPFRTLCGAAIAYGLTEGGPNTTQGISLTALGRRILEPLEDGDDLVAKREAILKPRVFREFLTKYDSSPLPKAEIGHNVLKNMGVPADRVEGVLAMIVESAGAVGLLRALKDKQYVDLRGGNAIKVAAPNEPNEPFEEFAAFSENEGRGAKHGEPSQQVNGYTLPATATVTHFDARARRVFITHGKNTAFIEPIKKLLGFGELEPVVSVEKQSVSQPVPDKVMNDMRSCGAAIIHVDGEVVLIDKDANEVTSINANVLIEIGAAMALYARRFILLVRDGVKLPSNLQGLYEVRYTGEVLDGNATIRLLEAINSLKSTPLPAKA